MLTFYWDLNAHLIILFLPISRRKEAEIVAFINHKNSLHIKSPCPMWPLITVFYEKEYLRLQGVDS